MVGRSFSGHTHVHTKGAHYCTYGLAQEIRERYTVNMIGTSTGQLGMALRREGHSFLRFINSFKKAMLRTCTAQRENPGISN